MTFPRSALALLVSLCLAPCARGEDVVRDEWFATYEGGVKIAWQRERVVRHERGYTIQESSWRRAGEQLTSARSTVETDRHGRVLQIRQLQEAPWGERRFELSPAEGGQQAWRCQIRALPVKTGAVKEGAIWSPTVIGLRVLAGELPPGKREITVFDIEAGTEAKSWSFERCEAEWKITGPGGTGVRDAKGRYLRGTSLDKPATTERGVSPSEAADLSKGDEGPKLEAPLVAKDALEVQGVKIKRLDPTWQLMHSDLGEGVSMLGCESAMEAGLIATRLPFSLPGDKQQRRALAETMRKKMNEEGTMVLAAPEPAVWRGKEVLRFSISGEAEGEPLAGVAYLVDAGEGTLLVMLLWPKDRAEELRAERSRLEQSLHFGEASGLAPKLQRVEAVAAGISLELPEGWAGKPRLAPSHWTSSAGASQVHVNQASLPGDVEFGALQEFWFQQQEANPALKVKVELADEVRVEGKRAYRMIVRGTCTNQGVTTPYRAATLAFPQPGNRIMEVVVVFFGLDADVESVDEVLESVKFLENH